MKLYRRIRGFLTKEVWTRDISDRPLPVRALFYLLRVLVLVARGLSSHQLSIWASSLTYFTLMSVVPFVALVAAVGAKLGVPVRIVQSFTGKMPEAQHRLISHAAAAFENMDFRAVGVVSIVLLVFAAMKVLDRVEAAFNEIWGVERRRGAVRRATTYSATVVVAPVLLIGAIVLTGSILSTNLVSSFLDLPVARTLAAIVLQVLPLGATIAALTLLYWLMPFTRVRFRAALLGGGLAGVLSQIAQQVFFSAQIGASRLGPIYGAFAAIPIFLVWVYLDWILILLGMEVAYSAQNARTWLSPIKEEDPVSGPGIQDLALRVALWLGAREGPHPAVEIARAVGTPARRVNRILGTLAETGVLTEVEEETYRLARQPSRILASEVTGPFSQDGEGAPPGPGESAELPEAVRRLRDRSREPYQVPLASLIEER